MGLHTTHFTTVDTTMKTLLRCGALLADDLFVAAGFDGEPWLAVRDEEGRWVLAMSLLAGTY